MSSGLPNAQVGAQVRDRCTAVRCCTMLSTRRLHLKSDQEYCTVARGYTCVDTHLGRRKCMPWSCLRFADIDPTPLCPRKLLRFVSTTSHGYPRRWCDLDVGGKCLDCIMSLSTAVNESSSKTPYDTSTVSNRGPQWRRYEWIQFCYCTSIRRHYARMIYEVHFFFIMPTNYDG